MPWSSPPTRSTQGECGDRTHAGVPGRLSRSLPYHSANSPGHLVRSHEAKRGDRIRTCAGVPYGFRNRCLTTRPLLLMPQQVRLFPVRKRQTTALLSIIMHPMHGTHRGFTSGGDRDRTCVGVPNEFPTRRLTTRPLLRGPPRCAAKKAARRAGMFVPPRTPQCARGRRAPYQGGDRDRTCVGNTLNELATRRLTTRPLLHDAPRVLCERPKKPRTPSR